MPAAEASTVGSVEVLGGSPLPSTVTIAGDEQTVPSAVSHASAT